MFLFMMNKTTAVRACKITKSASQATLHSLCEKKRQIENKGLEKNSKVQYRRVEKNSKVYCRKDVQSKIAKYIVETRKDVQSKIAKYIVERMSREK